MSPELRPATRADARAIWEWRNDPAARAASFSSKPIPWETHEPWFERRLADPDTTFLVATAEGRDVGYVRFAGEAGTREISVGLAPAARGAGLGRAVIRTACEHALATVAGSANAAEVIAHVKPTNEASLRAFRAAGFRDDGTAAIAGETAVRLVFP